jgi:hypothetical protein
MGTQRLVETNGIRLNVVEQGAGPLVQRPGEVDAAIIDFLRSLPR